MTYLFIFIYFLPTYLFFYLYPTIKNVFYVLYFFIFLNCILCIIDYIWTFVSEINIFNKIQDCHLENQLYMAGGQGSPLAYRDSNLAI